MKNCIKFSAIVLAAAMALSGCGREVEKSPISDFSSISAADSYSAVDSSIDGATDSKDLLISTTATSRNTEVVLPETIIPITSPPAGNNEAEEVAYYYEIVETPSEDIVETEAVEQEEVEEVREVEEEYIVYKPSTHYVHRSTCSWVDDTCYQIYTTEKIEARLCEDCNPDIEIVQEYKELETTTAVTGSSYWNGSVLTPSAGTVQGPSGKETYYNLDMSGVVSIMRGMGFDEESYPYWVRGDGCKMLGNYIMVAANLSIRPRGTTVETSLGTGLVCDTGGFAYSNAYQLDIATSW